MSIRLVLADDHPVILSGLQHLLGTDPGFQVVACANNGAEAVEAVARHKPDLLVIDLSMPVLNGLGAVRELKTRGLPTRVVILTANVEDDDVLEAIRLGVRGVVLKQMAPQLLLECIRTVHAGGQWLEKHAVGRALERMLQRESGRADVNLTDRELEIVRMVSQGLRNREVADQLFISEGTVKIHLHRIYHKLGVDGRMQLSRVAREKGLL